MNTITQIARFRQSVVKFSFNFGVISAVKRFNVSGGSVYRRRKRCNGSPESLVEYSRFCCIQTDNGLEFIKAFDERKKGKTSLFEKTLAQLGIKHKLIRPYTPRHNGKVERSHRKDNEYFYSTHRFMSFEDFRRQLYVHNRNYNNLAFA